MIKGSSLVGKVFGRLTIIKEYGRDSHKRVLWYCQCSCGKNKIITDYSLRHNITKSCGCLVQERLLSSSNKKENNPMWKGGKNKNASGYILIHFPTHPNANKKGYILEHVLNMSKYLGRPLTKKESVHHKNGIRDDNDITNLELKVRYHGYGQSVEDTVKYAISILKMYAPNILKEKI